MENKIQELTDKIYREGVEKGNEEAQKLIAKAQEEAKRIIEDAHKEADSIVATAHKSADELAENTKSELKLFAGQAVNALKSEIGYCIAQFTVFQSKFRQTGYQVIVFTHNPVGVFRTAFPLIADAGIP